MSNRLSSPIYLITVGARDHAVLLATAAWEATAKLGADDELQTNLRQLTPFEARMEEPKAVPPGGQHYDTWRQHFLACIRASCIAIAQHCL